LEAKVKLETLGVGIVLAASVGVPSAFGCGFVLDVAAKCTWRQQVAEAKVVAVGTLTNPRKVSGSRGATDFAIATPVKSDPAFSDKATVEIPLWAEDKTSVLVFFDIHKGQLDPYLLIRTSPASAAYLKGLLAVDGKDQAAILRYCHDFLQDGDPAIAADALLEFMKVPDKELGEAARTLRADKLRVWLKSPTLTEDQLRMFGFLLGNCGDESDAPLLRSLLESEAKAKEPRQFDGLLTGYVLLKPKEGWAYARQLVGDKKAEIRVRFSAWRAARFFFNTRPDVIDQNKVFGAFRATMSDPELADIAIDFLRQRKCWDLTDEILALYGAKSFEHSVIRNNILRYALQCPRPPAAQLIARVRLADPKRVEDMEDLFRELEGR
jgi:hypothetical protein